MKIINLPLYTYQELSPEAKKRAHKKWQEGNDDPLMQSHMVNLLKEELDARGIKYDTDSINIYYSLSYSQGDGFMFEGKLVGDRGIDITIKHDGNPYYYHSRTANIDIPEASEREYADFDVVYQSICEKLERAGYNEIEYQNSEEAFIEACEANEYTFESNGTMRTETHCPNDGTKLQYRMHDVDGTNLVETLTCLECGYGTPSLT
jgi:hypothetical protein